MSQGEVADRIGISKSTLGRIEKAEHAISTGNVGALLRLYGVAEDDIARLVELAKQARRRGWWAPYTDVLPDWFEVYVGLESDACRIAKYEPQLVPGLLQTADYARAVIGAGRPEATPAEVDRRVELRMARQARDVPLSLWVVLDETILRRVVGSPKVMRAQLERILEASEEPDNDIQVVPFSAGEHAGMGSGFTILSFPDPRDHSVVYIETRAGGLLLEEDLEVEPYPRLFDHLKAAASSVRTSREMISQTIHSL